VKYHENQQGEDDNENVYKGAMSACIFSFELNEICATLRILYY